MPKSFRVDVPVAVRNLWRVRLALRLIRLAARLMGAIDCVIGEIVPPDREPPLPAEASTWSPPFDAWADPDELREVPPPRRPALAFTVAVGRCARCGSDHTAVEFRGFTVPPDEATTHWGTCPDTGQPILMTIRP